MKQIKYYSLVFLILFFTAFSLFADDNENPPTDYDPLVVSIIISGQTEPLYVWWGHIGLIIQDFENNRAALYDFGNFTFDDSNFYKNFLLGNFYYRADKMPPNLYIEYMKRSERLLRIHTLNLPKEKKRELYEKLEWTVLPENRVYLYHHYNNNCSTKIRDLIDEAVYGQLQEKTNYQRGETLRKLSRYYSSHAYWGDILIHFLLSGRNDHPITLWQEMFIPDKFEEGILGFSYTDKEGKEIPLVADSLSFDNDYSGFYPRTSVSGLWTRGIWSGLILLAIAFVFSLLEYKRARVFKIIYGTYTILTCFFIGVLGSILLFMMTFTRHDYSFGNLNIFICHPLAFTGIGLAIWYLKNPEKGKKALLKFWSGMAFVVFVMIVMKIFPSIKQVNTTFIIMSLPLYLMLGIPGDFLVKKARNELVKRRKPRKYLD